MDLFGFSFYSHVVQDVRRGLQDRAEVLPQLEAASASLAQFVSSGEAARIRARLTQVGRYWEELGEGVQQLDGRLQERWSQQQKFSSSLAELQAGLQELQAELDQPIGSCSSFSETARALQRHTVVTSAFFCPQRVLLFCSLPCLLQDVSQALQQLKAPLLALSASARRLGDHDPAQRTVTELSAALEQALQEAKEKQDRLESLLSSWQRYAI